MQWKLYHKKHCRVLPGRYCEVHDKSLPSNSMIPCTHECIACKPTATGNLQGSVKFYCLNTGRILKQQSFIEMPMPNQVIRKVNRIDMWEKQGREFRFLNQSKNHMRGPIRCQKNQKFQGLLEEEAPFPKNECQAARSASQRGLGRLPSGN